MRSSDLRPETLEDIHIYVIPKERWLERRRLAKNHVVEYSISCGFVRVLPQLTLADLRCQIRQQLGNQMSLPRRFVFLRSVGRNFTQVKRRQEVEMKVKNFMPPYARYPEIYLKEGKYLVTDSGVDSKETASDSNTEGEEQHFRKNQSRKRKMSSVIVVEQATAEPLDSERDMDDDTSGEDVLSSTEKIDDLPLETEQEDNVAIEDQGNTPSVTEDSTNDVLQENEEIQAEDADSVEGDDSTQNIPVEGDVDEGPTSTEDAQDLNGEDTETIEHEISTVNTNEVAATEELDTVASVEPEESEPVVEVEENDLEPEEKLLEDASGQQLLESEDVELEQSADDPQSDDKTEAIEGIEGSQDVANDPDNPEQIEPDHALENETISSNEEQPNVVGNDDGPGPENEELNVENEDSPTANDIIERLESEANQTSDELLESVEMQENDLIEKDENSLEEAVNEQTVEQEPSADGRNEDSGSPENLEETGDLEPQHLESDGNNDGEEQFADGPDERMDELINMDASEDVDLVENTDEKNNPEVESGGEVNLEQETNPEIEEAGSEENTEEIKDPPDEDSGGDKDGQANGKTAEEDNESQLTNEEEVKPSMKRAKFDNQTMTRSQSMALAKKTGKSKRGARWNSMEDMSKLLDEMDSQHLRELLMRQRADRKMIEHRREELVRRISQLHSKASTNREHAREQWRRRFQETKKMTPRLEEECARLRQELERLLRDLLLKMEEDTPKLGTRTTEMPSDKMNSKLMVLRTVQEIEDVRRRVEGTKIRLAAEARLREQAESDVKALREELMKKKIQVTLTRKDARSTVHFPV